MEPIPYDAFSTHIWLVGEVGADPTTPEARDLQSPGFADFLFPGIWHAVLESNQPLLVRSEIFYPID